MTAAVDWGAVGTFAGLAVVMLGALVRVVVAVTRIEQAVKEHSGKIDQNSRHLDSTINAHWMLAMRTATMEDHLAREDGYHPPVIVPRGPDQAE